MFYQPELNNHGLPYAPFKAIVVPRPIAWISTIDRNGRVNLAPFSQYSIFGNDPPRVMFTVGQQVTGLRKDTLCNAEEQGEFVVNMATYEMREAVAATSAIVDSEDEMAAVGLTPLASRLVKPPSVKESPAHLECRYEQTISLPCDTPGNMQSLVIRRGHHPRRPRRHTEGSTALADGLHGLHLGDRFVPGPGGQRGNGEVHERRAHSEEAGSLAAPSVRDSPVAAPA